MKLWNKQYWNGVLALTLGWSVLGQCGAAEKATAYRDWKNSNGEIALRGALDVERTLDEASSEGAPNRVYFIDESGVSKYYRYRHLSAEDRKIVDEALDAPASPVSVPTEEAASAATKPNQAADVAAQNFSINGGVSEDEEETLAKLAALTDDARVAKERDGYKAGIAKLDKLLESEEVATDAALFEGVTVLKASWEKLNKYFPQGLDAFRSAEKAGERRSLTINGVEFPFRYCPSGTFIMGSAPNQTPPPYWNGYKDYLKEYEKMHTVRLTKGFWILETEVTQKMWTALGGVNVSDFPGVSKPAHNVSWFDCQEALTRLNNESGVCTEEFIFRLPTEAEWEYACRAGTKGEFNDDSVDGRNVAVLNADNAGFRVRAQPFAVASKAPNRWGLYDMHGNISEWCWDWRAPYPTGEVSDPLGPNDGDSRITRGSSYTMDYHFARSGSRSRVNPAANESYYGFRLVLASESIKEIEAWEERIGDAMQYRAMYEEQYLEYRKESDKQMDEAVEKLRKKYGF